MGYSAGVPAKTKVYSTHCLSLAHSTVTLSQKVMRLVTRIYLSLINLCWGFPMTPLDIHVFRNHFQEYLLHNQSHRLR